MILINGQAGDQISVADRALHYGDGLFETLAVKDGEILAWDRHMLRMQKGCERLAVSCPDLSLLHDEATSICKDSHRAVLKLIISRGQGGRGYQPPLKSGTTRILSLHQWPEYPNDYQAKGIEAGVCRTRLGLNPLLAGIKHLNRLEQVLLRQEVVDEGVPEAIVMDIEERVIEGSMSNIFLISNNTLSTPKLTNAGIEGVIRGRVLELADSLELVLRIKDLDLEEVFAAEELFFCNSIIGIWPVTRIRHAVYRPGPWTSAIRQCLLDENLIAGS